MATIHFQSVQYKNFLSTGNAENKIILDKSRTTLITGQNGNGKSTFLKYIAKTLNIPVSYKSQTLNISKYLNQDGIYPASIFTMAGVALFVGFNMTKKIEE